MNFRDAIRKGNGYAHKKAGHLVYEANFIFDYRNFGVDLHNCLFMTSKILESVVSPEVVIKRYGDKGWMPGKGETWSAADKCNAYRRTTRTSGSTELF